MHDEKQLLQNLFDRQPGAAQAFVRQFSRLITGAIRRFRLPPDQLDDLTQIIYEKLWEDDFRRLRQWKGNSALGAYLWRVAERSALDWLRAQGQFEEMPEDDELVDAQNEHPNRDPVGDEGALSELGEILRLAVGRMSDGCRQRITMRFFEDLDYHEIAQRLGTTVNSIRARVSQCLTELREILQTGWRMEGMPL